MLNNILFSFKIITFFHSLMFKKEDGTKNLKFRKYFTFKSMNFFFQKPDAGNFLIPTAGLLPSQSSEKLFFYF